MNQQPVPAQIIAPDFRRGARKPAKIVREDSASGRVFPIFSRGRKLRHEARWKYAGSWKRKVFSDQKGGKSSKTLAEDFLREQLRKIASGVLMAHGVTQADIQTLLEALEIIAVYDRKTGSTGYFIVNLREIVEFATEVKLMGYTFPEALTCLRVHNPRAFHMVPSRQCVDELLAHVQSRSDAKRIRSGDVRPSTENIRKLRIRLGKFADAFPQPLMHLETEPFRAWLNQQCKSPKTWNHYRAGVMQLARFARRKKYLSDARLEELLALDKFEVPERVADPHTAKELQAIMETAQLHAPDFICAIAAVVFCGFRVAEVASEKGCADFADFDLDAGEAFIRAGHSKVGKNRRVPIPKNAIAWFKKYGKASGPLCTVKSFTIKFKRLCRLARVKCRINGGRSGFISHDVALRGDKGSTAQRAGTSVAKIESNYLKWPSAAAARDWFGIEPADLQPRLNLQFQSPTRHHVTEPAQLPL